LGNRLRHLRKRVVEGKYIDLAGEDAKRVNRWAVFGAEQFTTGPASHAPHAPHPHAVEAGQVLADVEHVEHVVSPGAETDSTAGPNDEELF
jgi:hypothetical protein